MSEGKDLKLFGKTIQLPEMTSPAADSRGVPPPPRLNEHLPSTPNTSHDNTHCTGESQKAKNKRGHIYELVVNADPLVEKLSDTNEDGVQPLNPEENTDENASILTNENPKIDNEAARVKDSKTEEEEEEEEKTLKKPDKILPCPRCNSMDTKFCYYNNYNISQPRHFCKKCQRYWTAGGTMRNMPVGSGRRKNKNSISASHYRHITVSEALQSAQLDLPSGTHHSNLKPNSTVLTFGSDPSLCESKPNESHKRSDNGDDHSSGSSVTVTNSKGEVGGIGFSPQLPCFPGAPWTYPWNPMQLNTSIPPPALFPPGFPMPFYPAAPYWGCPVPGSWNVQWIAPPQMAAPNAPTLGKHSRGENELKSTNSRENETRKENNPEKCLWFPKTLRIDDPDEAARSSIWATLGIQNEKAGGSVSGGRLFKPFQSKGDEKDHISEASRVLHANPAAMCRSLNFRES